MWPAIISLLTGLPGLFGDYFKQRNELEKAKQETLLAIEVAKQKMASDIAVKEFERGTTQLQATSAWFKYFSFIMWFGPFIVGVIAPSWSHTIFENLKAMPEWYVQSCMIIMFAVWGITATRDTINSVFSGLGSFFARRQEINLNKSMFYQTLRSVKGNISQAEVDLYEKAFHNSQQQVEDK